MLAPFNIYLALQRTANELAHKLRHLSTLKYAKTNIKRGNLLNCGPCVQVVKVADIITTHNKQNISTLCPVTYRTPFGAHLRQARFCLLVCYVGFYGCSAAFPYLLIGPSHMCLNNLERDIK